MRHIRGSPPCGNPPVHPMKTMKKKKEDRI
ncbi:unnamed protein product [Spirodela intermedia]|uniref:Uncharacterized protein n=1 Tax=Spirodela intermedia TaxID=51605 RepID=A0A7I8KMR2_SPIIN|nr:unnamed protein product [Spirodela intermedia]